MRTAVLVGVCAGFALVTKISASFLFPMIALAALCRGRGQRARAIAFLLMTGAGATVAAGWYFLRNVIVFGDALASRFKLEIIADVATPWHLKVSDPYFYTRLPADLFLSFWGSFGWLTISAPFEALMVYAIVTGLLTGVTGGYLVETIRFGRSGRVERRVLAAIALGLGGFGAWTVYDLSLTIGIPGGLRLSHIEVAVAATAISFIYLILVAPGSRIDRRERQVALTLTAGIVTLLVELVIYNLSWPASQSRLMYPALAPLVIVLALAVRHTGAKLPWPRAMPWVIPFALATLGLAWVAPFAAGVNGVHARG